MNTLDCIGVGPAVTIRSSSGATLRFEDEFAPADSDGEHAFIEPGGRPLLLGVLALHTEVVADRNVSGARITTRFVPRALLGGWSNRRGPSWHSSEPGRARVEIDVLPDGDVQYRHNLSSAGDRR